jgi:hypothetical protein
VALEELTQAADLFRPVYDRTSGVDGWVDVHALSAQLQDEGAKSFVNSWSDLMGVIGSKCDVLKRAS